MSFRILTPLTTNRMSRLIFITLLSVLILTPQSIQAARRSRLDLTSANAASNTDSITTAPTETLASNSNNNDSESLKSSASADAHDVPMDNASALPLKTEQSSSSSADASSDSVASDSSSALPLTQDNESKSNTADAIPVIVDTGKSSATDLIAEDEKQTNDSELPKEQKEVPTASFEDAEIVDSATQFAASGSSDQHEHNEFCDSEMLGFEIVTG